MVRQLKMIFEEADLDCNGSLTSDEMRRQLKNKRVRAHLASMGLHLHEAEGLFRLLDVDGNGVVSTEEFIFGCMRLAGNAKSIDLATLMYENKRMMTRIKTFIGQVA